MQKWEVDLCITFSESQWRQAFTEVHRSSHCVKHWELMIKMANRWHYTPFRLATYFPGQSPTCWRGCGQVGNLLHMFWQCPSIRSLWNRVFQLISSLTGILTHPDPAMALLHLKMDTFPHIVRPIVTHILLESRLLVLCNWKSDKALNISEVVTAVHRNYTFERLIAINSFKCRAFDNCWSIWPKLV